jgi:hypothetical protein
LYSPGAVAALQRAAGNSAVTRVLRLQRFYDRFTRRDVDLRDLPTRDLEAYLGRPADYELTGTELRELLDEHSRRFGPLGERAAPTGPVYEQTEANRKALARLTGVSRPWFQGPVRRHFVGQVTLEDVKGHSTLTTVTAGDVDGDVQRINAGDFTRCWEERGALRIVVGGKTYGCTLHRENRDLILYPVDGPFCTRLTHEQLEAMVRIRDLLTGAWQPATSGATDPAFTAGLLRQWYRPDDLARAIAALERVGWNSGALAEVRRLLGLG